MKNNRTTRNRLITTLAKSTLIVLMFVLVFASVLSVSFGVDNGVQDAIINNNVADAADREANSAKTVNLVGNWEAADIFKQDNDAVGHMWHGNGEKEYHYLRILLSTNIQSLINKGSMYATVNTKYDADGGNDHLYIWAWYGSDNYSTTINTVGNFDQTIPDDNTVRDINIIDNKIVSNDTGVITVCTWADDTGWFSTIDCGVFEISLTLNYTPTFAGSGTASSPWELKTREDFDELSLMVRCGFVTSDKYFKVVPASGNTIDFEYDNKFIPIGGVDTDDDTQASAKDENDVALYTFKGTLDGNSSQILNLANKLS